tara:strand:- start:22 stop:324 length:303 start_codon:yes stop_codon:yes gene_type:complete
MAVDSSDPKKEQLGRFREHRDERKEYKGVNIAVVWKNISVQPVRLLRDSNAPWERQPLGYSGKPGPSRIRQEITRKSSVNYRPYTTSFAGANQKGSAVCF